MTTEPKCECGSDDWNARNFRNAEANKIPHALNCPKHPTAEAPKVCLDGCRWNIDPQGRNFFFHAPACPNNPEACEDPLCDLKRDHATPHRLRKPAPAPEPKGSEMQPRCAWEPGTPGECSAYLALRAEVERLKQGAARHEEEEAANCPEDQSCIETIKALRAELAQAREEIAKLERDIEFLSSRGAADKSRLEVAEAAIAEANSHNAFVYRERDAERAAREKAEEMLRSMKVSVVATIGGKVEGAPTHEGNYLQRLRQLLKAEARLVETEEAIEAGWKRGNYKGIEAAYRAILAKRKEESK